MIVPYAAIFPSGSLTVVQLNGEAVYAYNPDWLKWPYTVCVFYFTKFYTKLVPSILQGTLIVTFLCIVLGTSHLFSHNKTNLSFAFSHILSATRNAGFDDVLSAANRHHVPAKLLEQVGTIKFGILRDSGREAFARVEDLMSPEETQEEQGKEEAGCFGWGGSYFHSKLSKLTKNYSLLNTLTNLPIYMDSSLFVLHMPTMPPHPLSFVYVIAKSNIVDWPQQ